MPDLSKLSSPEEIGRRFAVACVAHCGAVEALCWTVRSDGRLRSLDGAHAVVTLDELGLATLPCDGPAAAAPASFRDRFGFVALPIRSEETLVAVLVLAFVGAPPPATMLAADLETVLTVAGLAFERAHLQAESARFDALGARRVGAGLTHTLSNVLQAALSSVESARQPAREMDHHIALDDALDALRRASALVRQLAVLGGTADEPAPVEVRGLVAGLVAALKPQMPPGVTLVLESIDEEAWVLVDRTSIEATLAGLVFAAREALGAVGRIVVRAGVDEIDARREITLSVGRSSNGGLRHAPPPGTRRTPDNNGGDTLGAELLGLTFARLAVERHGGQVHEVSSPDGAAIVKIALPEARRRDPLSSGTVRRVLTNSVRVLVADDEPAVLRGVTRMLQAAGHAVVPAIDGAEALALVRAAPGTFDVALLDLTMPKLSGPPLVAALRRVAPRMPVVVVTGYASEEMVDALKAEGVSVVLRKPVEASTLLSVLGGVMHPTRANDQGH